MAIFLKGSRARVSLLRAAFSNLSASVSQVRYRRRLSSEISTCLPSLKSWPICLLKSGTMCSRTLVVDGGDVDDESGVGVDGAGEFDT